MSRLSDYKAAMQARGADMSGWDKAYETTKACAAQARSQATSIGRMTAYLDCRTGKKNVK